jgi:hypothetical protein
LEIYPQARSLIMLLTPPSPRPGSCCWNIYIASFNKVAETFFFRDTSLSLPTRLIKGHTALSAGKPRLIKSSRRGPRPER